MEFSLILVYYYSVILLYKIYKVYDLIKAYQV
jgi:hypothetical protein